MTQPHDLFPILEHDPAPEAVIEPRKVIQPIDAPEHCVICFFQEVIGRLSAEGQLKLISKRKSEIGDHPVYELAVEGKRLALFHPGVGAPLAGALLDEVIALGCRKFIACGGAGVLNREIAVGHIVVPTSAVRDEGTSYHYLPPSREVAADEPGVAAIEAVLQAHRVPYVLGKTWTTDAFYRETVGKVERRRSEGCLTVEMEAAAIFAVARFRGVAFGQMLYGGDDVSGAEWDHRGWGTHQTIREKLFWLAAEACLLL
jgi:uridine phosphorylase